MAPSTPPPSGDFERLRKLLSLMAYEAPPPRYFDTFSGKVIARIQADVGEPATTWWGGMLSAMWARPWAGTAVALAFAALVVTGLGKASMLEPALADVDPLLSGAPAVVQAAMLDRALTRKAGETAFLVPSQATSVTPSFPELRPWSPAAAAPGSGAILPASFTPAY
jgi:hypothetical protein